MLEQITRETWRLNQGMLLYYHGKYSEKDRTYSQLTLNEKLNYLLTSHWFNILSINNTLDTR